jgi:hypothetical protein
MGKYRRDSKEALGSAEAAMRVNPRDLSARMTFEVIRNELQAAGIEAKE